MSSISASGSTPCNAASRVAVCERANLPDATGAQNCRLHTRRVAAGTTNCRSGRGDTLPAHPTRYLFGPHCIIRVSPDLLARVFVVAKSQASNKESSTFGAVRGVPSSLSSAQRIVAMPTSDSRARSSTRQRGSARAALIRVLTSGPRCLQLLWLAALALMTCTRRFTPSSGCSGSSNWDLPYPLALSRSAAMPNCPIR